MSMKECARLMAGLTVAIALAAGAARAATAVDLELALAVDVSGSIDYEEARLQREGYIAAFRHPDIARALRGGVLGRIAVAYYEWAGYGHNKIIAPWTLIDGAEAAQAFAEALTRQTAARTAIGSAIGFAIPFFDRNGFDGTRRVVDVSGDGPNNWGVPVTVTRDRAVAAGITINGLPIVNDRPSPFGWPSLPDLDLYYRDCVIGGPGAFIVVAQSFKDFALAIRRKLVLEIANLSATGRERSRVRDEPPRLLIAQRRAPPCDAGERRWQGRRDF
jgi:hypothetical protein